MADRDPGPGAGEQCQIALMPSGRRGRVARGTNLLEAARQLGVELESICGGRQTCGKCQIVVQEGHFPKHGLTSKADHVSPVDGREATYRQKHPLGERRLACAAQALGDLLIVVPEESQARKQTIAKAAGRRTIDVRPAVWQWYVEVAPAALGDRRGDWERLRQAIADQWELAEVTIDPVVLPDLQSALRAGGQGVTVSLWQPVAGQPAELLRVQPGYAEGAYGLAVDVGSTTVAAHLCDLRTGAVLATEATMNPQVRFGEDLMSRVSYGMMEPGGVAQMHQAIIATLNELALRAASTAAASAGAAIEATDILELVLVGNTVMHHLLLGIDPVELGGAPFALAVDGPLDLKARDLGLTAVHRAARVHVLPCIAGHVGADNTAVFLAEAPQRQEAMTLIVDVGTNAEILLGNRQEGQMRVLSASSPTGPAFEGAQISHGQRAAPGAIERVRLDPETLEPRFKVIGSEAWRENGEESTVNSEQSAVNSEQSTTAAGAGARQRRQSDPPLTLLRPTGICGSGIIEAVAEMFLAGVIGADGRFAEAAAARSPRVRFDGRSAEYVLVDAAHSATGRPIVITQNDVRAIQLAKAALYAGVKLLMQRRGVEQVERVVLAGAFGTYISPRHAMVLGLIPDCDLEKVTAVGNAAGDGARIALLNREERVAAARLVRQIEYVETAVEPAFQEEFVAAMALPHASDPFPQLLGILPQRVPAAKAGRRRRKE
jgi:uncharacterized 2Fe-2S/4Fe-4S cluster protein (DUF4445 family)